MPSLVLPTKASSSWVLSHFISIFKVCVPAVCMLMAGRDPDFSDLGTFPSLLPVLIVSETDLRRGLYLCVWNHFLRWIGRTQNLSQGSCQADSLTHAQITENASSPYSGGWGQSQARYSGTYLSIITAFKRLRQKDCKFQASLSYIESSV